MRKNRNLPWRIIDSCLIVSLLAAQPNVAAYAAEGSDPGIVSMTSEDDFVLLTENCKTCLLYTSTRQGVLRHERSAGRKY